MNENGIKTHTVVLIDEPIVCLGLTTLLSNYREPVSILGTLNSFKKAHGYFDSVVLPDVVILEPALGDGIDLIKSILARFHDMKIVAYTHLPENIYASRFLAAGGKGFIPKSTSFPEVLRLFQEALQGGLAITKSTQADLAQRVYGRGRRQILADPVDDLTDRELEVFRLVGDSYSTARIAEMLHLSKKTIETHKAHIKEKMGYTNASELLRAAFDFRQGSSQGSNSLSENGHQVHA